MVGAQARQLKGENVANMIGGGGGLGKREGQPGGKGSGEDTVSSENEDLQGRSFGRIVTAELEGVKGLYPTKRRCRFHSKEREKEYCLHLGGKRILVLVLGGRGREVSRLVSGLTGGPSSTQGGI